MGKKAVLLPSEALDAWLDEIARTQTLIAPRRVDGLLLYRPVSDSSQIARQPGRPLLSVKEVLFPPTERLFTIQKTKEEIHLQETLPEGRTVVFGLRPCDAQGLRLLDAVFLDTEPVDPYYACRREHTTLVGLACQEMGPNCFCTSVGGAPDDPLGMDVMLTQGAGGYQVEAISEKGHALLTQTGWPETVSGGAALETSPSFRVPEQQAWPAHFNNEYWLRMGERCLSCRACAYVCPTCRCFAVRDEALAAGQFERLRCWDACTGENYRRVAGGHKPRPEKGERLRNRFFCKFYYYPEQYGLGDTSACTGCGRCLEVCPAGVDITEVLVDLEKPA
jgi:sulfhydrogenase subunit beta (sulfur reductase)